MDNSIWNKKDAKEYYKSNEKQIKQFLKICSKEDLRYYDAMISKMTEILKPYENAAIIDSSLTDQLLEVRKEIEIRGGETAVNVVSARVRLNCPTAWYIFNNLDQAI
jgi:type I site-specific restriction-modification system R (restriction) subunit